MKRVGFFGGSFDPIHFGHLNLAVELSERHRLDEILFCPANISPFKKGRPPQASGKERLSMLSHALEEFPRFKPLSLEVNREGPSYTVETLEELKKEGEELFFLLSSDVAADFHLWKEPKKILEIARPLVGGDSPSSVIESPFSQEFMGAFTPIRRFDISSTEVRRRLQEKLCVAHMVPLKALDYIREHRLYSC